MYCERQEFLDTPLALVRRVEAIADHMLCCRRCTDDAKGSTR